MRKIKFALLSVLAFVVCALAFAACGGEQLTPTGDGTQSGTTTFEPNGSAEEDAPNTDGDQNKQPEGGADSPENEKDPEHPEGENGENISGEEKPDVPEQPDPEQPKPTEPIEPVEPIEPEPIIPDEPGNPDPEPGQAGAVLLKEGCVASVEKPAAEYSFVAETAAYYAVKIAGESINGELIVGGKPIEMSGGEYFLYGVYLEKDEELKISVETCGGQIGVFCTARISESIDEDYAAVSSPTQKYFVYVADGDTCCGISLCAGENSETLGNCYIGGEIYYDDPDMLEVYFKRELTDGEIIVVWVENAGGVISVCS